MQFEIAEVPGGTDIGAGRLVDELAILRRPAVTGRVVGFPAVEVLAIKR
jgi:hypothetical protein